MASLTKRDPLADHLLAPENSEGMVEIGMQQGGPWATEIAIKQFAMGGAK